MIHHELNELMNKISSLSDQNDIEKRYQERRGLKHGRRLGCQAKIINDF